MPTILRPSSLAEALSVLFFRFFFKKNDSMSQVVALGHARFTQRTDREYAGCAPRAEEVELTNEQACCGLRTVSGISAYS